MDEAEKVGLKAILAYLLVFMLLNLIMLFRAKKKGDKTAMVISLFGLTASAIGIPFLFKAFDQESFVLLGVVGGLWLISVVLAIIASIKVGNMKKIGGNSRRVKNLGGKGISGKGNEITTGYRDEIVSEYLNNEQKSGCFGRKPKWTDKDYDNILLRWLNANATKEFALHKLGVDESQVNEIEPICFQGFESEDAFVGRYGLDGKFRTSQYSVTWLFFSDSQIFVFNIFYDLLYHKTKIITYEYFYKDITNFSSIFSSYEYEKFIEKKGCMSKGFDKELKKIETQKFSIVVPGDSFSCSVSGVAKIDGIIQGLKQKLREKKEQRG